MFAIKELLSIGVSIYLRVREREIYNKVNITLSHPVESEHPSILMAMSDNTTRTTKTTYLPILTLYSKITIINNSNKEERE